MSGGPLCARLVFLLCCLLLPSIVAASGRANIFIYHRFAEPRLPSTNISAETFAAQLQYLHDQHIPVLALGEVAERLARGAALPERCVVLTVDDAYRSFLQVAMPFLRPYRFPVTLFVNSDSVGQNGYLSWEELRSLQEEGVEIGNHTASHNSLVGAGWGKDRHQRLARMREDILKAQRALTSALGREPRLFAYPYGEYADDSLELVRGLGFIGAVAQTSGVVGEGADRYQLPRFPMGGTSGTLDGFRSKAGMRPLPVKVVAPDSRLVGDENPPVLTVEISDQGGIDTSRLAAFVDGQPTPVTGNSTTPGRFQVQSERVLTSRRSHYTLTAPGRDGRGWYWFTYLWIRPERR